MALDKVSESVKSFFDARLKSPYFASVFCVWLLCNKVLIFGLFNFDKTMTLPDRIEWVSDRLSEFNFIEINGHYILSDFSGSVVFSVFVGFFAMLFFSLINGIGYAGYKWINKFSASMAQKVDSSNWISLRKYEALERDYEDVKVNLHSRQSELQALDSEFNANKRLLNERSTETLNLKKDIESLTTKIKLLELDFDNPKRIATKLNGKYNSIDNLFLGKWLFEATYENNEQKRTEFEVDGNLLLLDKGDSFIIKEFQQSQDRITFTKVDTGDDSIKKKNRLFIMNERWLEGWEDESTFVRYKRIN